MSNETTVNQASTWFALFASAGTLVCCALPVLLVSLGLGAVVAGATYRWPFLVTLSEHPGLMFGGSAAILAVAGWLVFLRPQQCPTDPILAARCQRIQILNRGVWWVTVMLWAIGFSARFLLV